MRLQIVTLSENMVMRTIALSKLKKKIDPCLYP